MKRKKSDSQEKEGSASSTQGSRPTSRRTISNVRSSLSQPNSLITESYATSVQELIGADRGSVPWYAAQFAARYSRLWLPTETVSLDLPSSFSSTSSRPRARNLWSWAEVRGRNSPQRESSERICYRSSTCSAPVTTASASTRAPTPSPGQEGGSAEQKPPRKKRKTALLAEKGLLLRTRRIRVVPTKEQREQIKKTIGVHRFIYNQCVTLEEAGYIEGASKGECAQWRPLLTNREEYLAAGLGWMDDATTHTKQQAVEEFFRAKRAAYANVANGTQQQFTMQRRSKFKARQETVPLERYALKTTGGAPTVRVSGVSGELKIRGKVPRELAGRNDATMLREEVKLTRTRLGYYYLAITVQIPQKPAKGGDAVALDPGARTFQTWYSDNGTCGKVGKFGPLQDTLNHADGLKSKLDKGKAAGKPYAWRRRIHRQFLRALEKVRNRVTDLHHKVGSWLCSSFGLILIPIFETQDMLSAGHLHNATCRKLQTWSHYRFRTFLAEHAQLYQDVKVRVANEAFTTKTCGRCGHIYDVGASEVFQCPSCGLTADRDYHAARNILLRALQYIL